MSAGVLYFVTDEEGVHIMTAPASTLENVFGLTAEQLMRMLRETNDGLECKLSRQGRRVMDKTIRVRREDPVSEVERLRAAAACTCLPRGLDPRGCAASTCPVAVAIRAAK